MMYAQLHPPHGDGEVTDEEMIVDLGEVHDEEEEDPEELVYFSDEDEVSSGMDMDADD